MVVGLLTLLTLAVIQLGLALHVRNTLPAGEQRTRDLIAAAVGPSYTHNVTATLDNYLGYPAIVVTVTAPLPVIGLVGFSDAQEVVGHAPSESPE
jgi:hypothetical protein